MSEESQQLLCSLLPSTAFFTHQPALDPTHPGSSSDTSTINNKSHESERSPATLDPMFFNSPFVLSAAHTWQDHIFSGWLKNKARDTVSRYEQGVRDGTMHAEWKDEEWQRDHQPPKRSSKSQFSNLPTTLSIKLMTEPARGTLILSSS